MSKSSSRPLQDGFRPSVQVLEDRAVPAAAITSAAFVNASIDEGQQASLSFEFQTPSTGNYSYQVRWGDGRTTEDAFKAGQEGSVKVNLDHVYADNGNLADSAVAAKVIVTDPEGTSRSKKVDLQVKNVAPVVQCEAPVSGFEGIPLTATLASFKDPGFNNPVGKTVESFTATIDWGDGTTTAGVVSSTDGSYKVQTTGTVGGSHNYAAAGTYKVTISVTDDDGGVGTTECSVTILPPPTSTLSGRVYAEENGNTSYQDGIDLPIGGVTINLDGTDQNGAVHRTTKTLADGTYSFASVLQGQYTLSEVQPFGYLDGADYVGTQGTTVGNDFITIAALPGGTVGTGNDFTEKIPTSLGCPTAAVPVITGISRDDGASSTDGKTTDGSLVLRGTGEPNANLTVLRGGVAIGTVQVDNAGQWVFDSTGTTLGAGKYDFAVRQDSLGPLGVAGQYNAFAFADADLFYADAWGGVAAGNNLTVNGFGVATRLNQPPQHLTSLVAGNKLAIVNSQVYAGDVVYGSTANVYQSTLLKGSATQAANYIDFAAAKADLVAKSAEYATYPSTGTVTSAYGVLRLTGTRSTLNIFTVQANQLNSANTLIISAPPGSRVLINVVGGGQVRLQNMGMQVEGVTRQDVLFNLPDATSLNISGVSVQGSILAPKAHVWFTNGNIEGTLVANSIAGSGQFHLYPLNHDCPTTLSADYRATVKASTAVSTPPAGLGSAQVGNSTFVLTGPNTVSVFDNDGSLKGSFTLQGLTNASGLASENQSLYVIDKTAKRVVVYTNVETKRWGTAAPTRSFALIGATVNPVSLSLDGGLLWITDAGRPGARDGYVPVNGQFIRRG